MIGIWFEGEKKSRGELLCPHVPKHFLLAAFGLSAALAQISTGSIAGVVEDASGAVVPNAEIAIKQTATGESRASRSNTNGEFNVPFLQPGGYTVTATAGGFKTKSLAGITLRVDQTINLRVALDAGASSELVEVTGSAPLVDSATSSLGQVIENKQIINLPLNGRNPFALGVARANLAIPP